MKTLWRSSKRARAGVVAVASAFSLFLAACGGDGDNATGGSDVAASGSYNIVDRDSLRDGGTLNLPLSELSIQQNPFHADGTLYTNTVWDWYNPVIVKADGAGNFEPNPAYLTDMSEEIVDGKTVVTYTINEEASYNDGTPIDWKTFEHTWRYNNGDNEELNVSSTDGYVSIESVKRGESDKQAVVTFKQAYPWWEGLFNRLLPTQVDDAEAFNGAYNKELHPEWGAGPFKVKDYDFNSNTVSFERNEKWWGNAPKLETVNLRYMEDQASINAFKAGEIDATGVAEKDRYATAQSMSDVDIRTALRPSNYLLMLNSKSPALEDIKVREAVMSAIDREQLAKIRFNGLDYEEALPGSFTLFQTQEGYRDNFSEAVTYDAERAVSLLESAGYEREGEGFFQKDGKPLTLNMPTTGDSAMVKNTASALQQMLKGAGIDLKVEERPTSDFSNIVTKREFDVFLMGFSSSDPFGVAYFDQVYNSESQLNRSGTGTPELDEKIKELQQISDAEEQIERANELEVEAFKTFGIMPYANGPDMVATKKGLANYGAYGFAIVPKEDIGWQE